MREYAVVMDSTTIQSIANVTVVIINPVANYPIGIMRAWWSQRGTAVSAQQSVSLNAKQSPWAGTYTGVTPRKLNTSDPVSKITSNTNGAAGTAGVDQNATEGGGTATALYGDAVNNLNGFLWVASPLEMLRFNPIDALAFTLKLDSAPSAAENSAGAYFVELA